MRSERFDTPGKVRLEVDNQSGNVDVVTHDEPVTLIEVDADGGGSDLVDQATVAVTSVADGFEAQVRIPRARRRLLGIGQSVRVTVRLPHDSDLAVKTASADTEASGRYGRVAVETASGDVTVDEGFEVRIRTASGDVSVGAARDEVRVHSTSGDVMIGRTAGSATLSTTSGDLRVGTAGGRVKAESVSGDIGIDLVEDGAQVGTVSGDVRITCVAAGNVALQTVSGDAVIGIPSGRELEVDAQTLSGSLSSDFDLDSQPARAGAGAGDPGPRVSVRATSVSGHVRLARALEPPRMAEAG